MKNLNLNIILVRVSLNRVPEKKVCCVYRKARWLGKQPHLKPILIDFDTEYQLTKMVMDLRPESLSRTFSNEAKRKLAS